VIGCPGDDLIDGDSFADGTIGNANSHDLISGDDGKDTIWGGPGDDTLSGGLGDDILLGRQGNDLINGGEGADTLVGSNRGHSEPGDVFDDPSQIDESFSIDFEALMTDRTLQILTPFL
jgi:Ca2+-binding RTX toxin-like protein